MNKLHPNTLKNNLQALEKLNPALVERIKTEPDVDWLELIQAKDGQLNLLIRSGSRMIEAYQDDGPIAEIRKAVKTMKLHKQNACILLGAGLGHRLREHLSHMEQGHHTILIEPVMHLLRLALSRYNVAKYILDGSLIIPTPDEQEIATLLSTLDSIYVIEEWIFSIERYIEFRYQDYGKFVEAVSKQINQVRCNVGTVMGAGYKIADNDIANLPYVIRHRGVVELARLFKNKPAIIVSTGPSLGKHIHKLKGIRDRAVIVAVAQALRPLLAYDVMPDMICTVDFGEVNMAHLDGLMDTPVPLVVLNRAYAPLVQAWEGPKFVCATPVPGFEHTACGILQHRGWVDQGGSVSHMCLGLAYHMGCNPIILIGQDLALGGTSHFMQADAAGRLSINDKGIIEWDVRDPRCPLLSEHKNTMGAPVMVPGYYGDSVTTNNGLLSFIRSFEILIKNYKDRHIINSTEGGAKISGAEQLPFDRAMRRYCKRPIDKSKLLSMYSPAEDADELIDKVIPMLHDEVKVLNTVRKESALGLRALRQIKKCPNDKTERLKKLLAINEQHSNAAHAAAKKNNLLGVAIFKASREIYSRELRVKGTVPHLLKYKKDLKIRIKRNELILKAALEAAKSLRRTYLRSIELLEEYQRTKDPDLLICAQNKAPNLDDAEQYFEIGNWAHPLLDARRIFYTFDPSSKQDVTEIYKKALQMREADIEKAKQWDSEAQYKLVRYNDLIERSRELGAKEQKFDEALTLLCKAIRICSERIEARWGYATTLHHVGRIEEALKEYKKLVKQHPDNLTFRYEMGIVQLKTDEIAEGMETINTVLEKTDKYDSFLQHMGDLYMTMGMYDKALSAYKRYLRKFPLDHEAWTKKAYCLETMGRHKEANSASKEAQRIKPHE